MEGMARPFGGDVSVEWEGKTILLRRIGFRHFASAEQHLLKLKRQAIFDIAKIEAESFPEAREAIREKAHEKAFAIKEATILEVKEWLDTLDGMAYVIWLNFQYHGTPDEKQEFTLEKCMEFLDGLAMKGMNDKLEEIRRAANQAAGVDPAGEATGPLPSGVGLIESGEGDAHEKRSQRIDKYSVD